ncbi:MAG TPA: neutral zinc metallopeptidase [Gemmatimonadaceae bacterium]
MRWVPGGGSRNVEDRRGQGMGLGAPVGIGGGLILLILTLLFGSDLVTSPDQSQATRAESAAGEVEPVEETPEEAREVQFVSWVLDTAQSTWTHLAPERLGVPWHDAKLVLFRGATRTSCGVGQTAMGPFYCPLDEKLYIDLSFYDDLKKRFGAPGDFAQAYVLAHELGHHVQHLMGTDAKVRRFQRANPSEANQASVALELQADCYAGVWGYYAQQGGALEAGDLEEGLTAAAAVGDDRIQKQTTGQVNMDSFTHGSSAQREAWFKRGFETGDPRRCDTFR